MLLLTSFMSATTWYPSEQKCPLCQKKAVYQAIGSYGSYIYQWETKYQYVYWPLTDQYSVYSCPHCFYSVFMSDFDSIPDDRKEAVQLMLDQSKPEGKYKEYSEIPVCNRMEIAEKVYKILGRDAEFWCRFYRVMAYYYEQEGNAARAKEARIAALGLAREMLNDPIRKGTEKETIFIIAAMHRFTEQKDSALFYLKEAESLKYINSEWKKENSDNLDKYLSDLIVQYVALIRKED